jgi:hypothetical protein
MSLIQGLAFASAYAIAGIPLGMLADRAEWDPAMQPTPAAPPAPAPVAPDDTTAEEVRRLTAELWQHKTLQAMREAING